MVRYLKPWCGVAGGASSGASWLATARRGRSGKASLGFIRCGVTWSVTVWQSRHRILRSVVVSCGPMRRSRFVLARSVSAPHDKALRGVAGPTRQVSAAQGKAAHGSAGPACLVAASLHTVGHGPSRSGGAGGACLGSSRSCQFGSGRAVTACRVAARRDTLRQGRAGPVGHGETCHVPQGKAVSARSRKTGHGVTRRGAAWRVRSVPSWLGETRSVQAGAA